MEIMKKKITYITVLVALIGFFGITGTTFAGLAPTMSTTPTGTYADTTATLSGFYTDNGSPTSTWFQYSTNAGLVGAISTIPVLQPGPSGPYTKSITGLTPGTWYYYRAVGQNMYGTTYATSIYSFKTTGGYIPACTIDSFTASPTTVTSGNSSILSWNTTNCSSVTISGIAGAFGADGSTTTPTLTSTTTYVLTATGDITDTQSLTVTVTPVISTCSIDSYYASPTNVTSGNSSTLYWNTTNCTTVSISGGNIGGTYSLDGSVNSGSLYNTTSYTLTASGSNTVSSTVSVTVDTIIQNQTCSITSFYASPSVVTAGMGTTLYWNTNGCNSVTLSGGNLYGNYSTNGSTYVSNINSATTFTITAYGTNTQTLNVYVSINYPYPNNPQQYNYACSDGIDNDGDGKIDMADVGCSSTYDSDEYNYVTPVIYNNPVTYSYACSDGIDNDGDGRVDMNDSGCYATTDTSEYNLVIGTTISNTLGTGNINAQNSAAPYGTYNRSSLAGLALFSGTFLPNSLLAWLIIILIIMGIVLISRKMSRNNNHYSNH